MKIPIIKLILLLFFMSHFPPKIYAQTKQEKQLQRLFKKNPEWELRKLKRTPTREHGALAGTFVLKFYKKREVREHPQNHKKNIFYYKILQFSSTALKQEKEFIYEIKNDSIVLNNQNEWNDYKVISFTKKEIVLKQVIDNYTYEMTFIPLIQKRKTKSD